jgi:hypothetical protein
LTSFFFNSCTSSIFLINLLLFSGYIDNHSSKRSES